MMDSVESLTLQLSALTFDTDDFEAELLAAEQRALLLSQRAQAYLCRQQWRLAMQDAAAAMPDLSDGMSTCLMRQAHALLCLQRLDEARALLALLPQPPAHPLTASHWLCVEYGSDPALELARLTGIMHQVTLESSQGQYDIALLKQEVALSGTVSPLHAAFESTDLKLTALAGRGGGRGLIAQRHIPAHTLVMAHKAFAYVSSADPDLGSLLWREIVNQLKLDPQRRADVFHLSGGNDPSQCVAVDPVIASTTQISTQDEALVGCILYNNWFGCPPFAEEADRFAALYRSDPPIKQCGAALFLRGGLLNHSCAPNCVYRTIGDFVLVFTSQTVAPGQELCQSYLDNLMPFQLRAQELSEWNRGDGFVCACVRCDFARSHAHLARLESEVHEALMNMQRLQRTSDDAVDIDSILSAERRRKIRNALDDLPLVHRAALLLLNEIELECRAVPADEIVDLLEMDLQVREAVGLARSFGALKSTLLLCKSLIECRRDKSRASTLLQKSYRLFCGAALSLMSVDNFKFLASKFLGTELQEFLQDELLTFQS
jgi:hypothetical protein